jgi:hypothetical protein
MGAIAHLRKDRSEKPVRRRPRLRVLLTTAAVVLSPIAVTAVTAAVSPTPALAATCYNTSCDGRDPQATGCAASAYTLTSSTIYMPRDPTEGFGNSSPIGRVDLRFSPVCGTKWIRLSLTDSSSWWYFHMFTKAWRPSDGGRFYIEYGHYSVGWTNMLAGLGRQVCGWGSLFDGSFTYYSQRLCV